MESGSENVSLADKSQGSKYYVFTLNNYTSPEVLSIQKSINSLSDSPTPLQYLCFGYELGGKKNTPHLQSYIELKKPGN